VKDSKLGSEGPALFASREAWSAFTGLVKAL